MNKTNLITMGFIGFSLISFPVFTMAGDLKVFHEIKHDTSLPLRSLRAKPASFPQTIRPLLNIPTTHLMKKEDDFALQKTLGAPLNITLINNFTGIGVGLGPYIPSIAPPDTTGSVGSTQYVQWVNADLAVFDKRTGQVIYGPVTGNTVWSGFGGLCETSNRGDPVVKYDQLANRWVLSQFAFPNGNNGPFFQCIAVSTSSDATGTYNRYAFQFNNFNDYGKLALWPDGYYITYNMFYKSTQYLGPAVCAYDRNAMLAGKFASTQCYFIADSTVGTLIPADLDGKSVPNKPEYLLTFKNVEGPVDPDLNLYRFQVDWNNPSNTTFDGPYPVTSSDSFTIACPNTSGNACVPQPNTSNRIDTLSDRLMYRLAYRQFPTYGALVINHTISGPSNLPAVRWYQINVLNIGIFTPRVFQQGTYAPDINSRFLGSMAMDKKGNIAVGYSIASAFLFPSIAINGRMREDDKGVLRNEMIVQNGTASQTTSSRWGDYSTMSIDPVDDCTFWYTNEYLQAIGGGNWSTRIVAFKFPNCSA